MDHNSDSDSDREEHASYCPGGYHPVKIGEIYNNRYLVERKLGYGHFSTVWLASDEKLPDNHPNKLVALKIQKSAQNYTEAALDEIKLLQTVKEESFSNRGASFVVQLLDQFQHRGPNGDHVCLVFEPMGKNILRLIKHYDYRGMPTYIVKIMTRQLLLGLDFLHRSCRIIHTDLKPENFLMLPSIPYDAVTLRQQRLNPPTSLLPHSGVRQQQSVKSPTSDLNQSNVHFLPGMPDPQGVIQQIDNNIDPIATSLRRFTIKISDLGNGCWIHHHFTEDIATRQYRSPEVIVGLGYTETADIWATACIIFELLTAEFLFDPREDPTGVHSRNEDHLALIRELMGPFPQSYFNDGRFSRKYFTKRGDFMTIKELHEWPLFNVLTDKYGMAKQEALLLSNTLLLPMLNLDHTKRCQASEALKSPWLHLTPVDIAAMYFDCGQIERLPLTIAKQVLEYEAVRVGEVQLFVEKTRYTPTRMDRYIRKHCPYHIWLKETYGESIVEALDRIQRQIDQLDPEIVAEHEKRLHLLSIHHDSSYLVENETTNNNTNNNNIDDNDMGDSISTTKDDEQPIDENGNPILTHTFTDGSDIQQQVNMQDYVDDDMHLINDDDDDIIPPPSSQQQITTTTAIATTTSTTMNDDENQIQPEINDVQTPPSSQDEQITPPTQPIPPLPQQPSIEKQPSIVEPQEQQPQQQQSTMNDGKSSSSSDDIIPPQIAAPPIPMTNDSSIDDMHEEDDVDSDEMRDQIIISPTKQQQEPEPESQQPEHQQEQQQELILPSNPNPQQPSIPSNQPSNLLPPTSPKNNTTDIIVKSQPAPPSTTITTSNRPTGSLILSRLSIFEQPNATPPPLPTTTNSSLNNRRSSIPLVNPHPPTNSSASSFSSTHSSSSSTTTTTTALSRTSSSTQNIPNNNQISQNVPKVNQQQQPEIHVATNPSTTSTTQSSSSTATASTPAPSRVSTLAQLFESMSKK